MLSKKGSHSDREPIGPDSLEFARYLVQGKVRIFLLASPAIIMTSSAQNNCLAQCHSSSPNEKSLRVTALIPVLVPNESGKREKQSGQFLGRSITRSVRQSVRPSVRPFRRALSHYLISISAAAAAAAARRKGASTGLEGRSGFGESRRKRRG